VTSGRSEDDCGTVGGASSNGLLLLEGGPAGSASSNGLLLPGGPAGTSGALTKSDVLAGTEAAAGAAAGIAEATGSAKSAALERGSHMSSVGIVARILRKHHAKEPPISLSLPIVRSTELLDKRRRLRT